MSTQSSDASQLTVSKWTDALNRLVDALRLLDESEAPPEIGATLDLAIHRLRNAIDEL